MAMTQTRHQHFEEMTASVTGTYILFKSMLNIKNIVQNLSLHNKKNHNNTAKPQAL